MFWNERASFFAFCSVFFHTIYSPFRSISYFSCSPGLCSAFLHLTEVACCITAFCLKRRIDFIALEDNQSLCYVEINPKYQQNRLNTNKNMLNMHFWKRLTQLVTFCWLGPLVLVLFIFFASNLVWLQLWPTSFSSEDELSERELKHLSMLQVAEREVSAMLPKECEGTAAAVTKRWRSMCCTEDRKIGKY